MTATALELLSFSARRFIQFETRFYQELPERRKTISEYFQKLATAILNLKNELDRKNVPHEAARDLAKLASLLADNVENELGASETERLRLFIEQACDTDRIYREYTDTVRVAFLGEELIKAYILLQALSNGLFLVKSDAPTPPLGSFIDPVL